MTNIDFNNNLIKQSSANKNSFDFYSQFGSETKLKSDYFTKSLMNPVLITKVRFDSLPLHSSLTYNNIQIIVGQEVPFDYINKIIFKSSIDQYDQFSWSGFVNADYMPSVVMKVGVGACGTYFITSDINKTIPSNTPYAANSIEFQNASIETSFCPTEVIIPRVIDGILISQLPSNGIVTFNNGFAINIDQTLIGIELDSLIYTPNLNYTGNDSFDWKVCFNKIDPNQCISNTSKFNISIPSQAISSSSAQSISLQPIQTSQGGGSITITNIQSSSSQTTSSSTITQSSTQTSFSTKSTTSEPTETLTTTAFDINKLKNNKSKPRTGVLSESDDKFSIEDPYSCGGDIYGFLEYSGNNENLEVMVKIKNKLNDQKYNLSTEFDISTGIYRAKIDYATIPESNYTITYSAKLKLSNKILGSGNYDANITNKCKVDQSASLSEEVNLPRTGGNEKSINLSLFIMFFIIYLAWSSLSKIV